MENTHRCLRMTNQCGGRCGHRREGEIERVGASWDLGQNSCEVCLIRFLVHPFSSFSSDKSKSQCTMGSYVEKGESSAYLSNDPGLKDKDFYITCLQTQLEVQGLSWATWAHRAWLVRVLVLVYIYTESISKSLKVSSEEARARACVLAQTWASFNQTINKLWGCVCLSVCVVLPSFLVARMHVGKSFLGLLCSKLQEVHGRRRKKEKRARALQSWIGATCCCLNRSLASLRSWELGGGGNFSLMSSKPSCTHNTEDSYLLPSFGTDLHRYKIWGWVRDGDRQRYQEIRRDR